MSTSAQIKHKKSQAAMEFLMTYGWAILVVLAAIAALAYFGVLNPELSPHIKFSPFCESKDYPDYDSYRDWEDEFVVRCCKDIKAYDTLPDGNDVFIDKQCKIFSMEKEEK